jgi:hypothetical protein
MTYRIFTVLTVESIRVLPVCNLALLLFRSHRFDLEPFKIVYEVDGELKSLYIKFSSKSFLCLSNAARRLDTNLWLTFLILQMSVAKLLETASSPYFRKQTWQAVLTLPVTVLIKIMQQFESNLAGHTRASFLLVSPGASVSTQQTQSWCTSNC